MAPDPDRSFTLKQAEIAVFNRDVWDLLWDFTIIADMAKVCLQASYLCMLDQMTFFSFSTCRLIAQEAHKLCGWPTRLYQSS